MSEAVKQALPVLSIVLATVAISALSVLFIIRTVGSINPAATKLNRDGIACILEQLNTQQQSTLSQPDPRLLIEPCNRFLTAP